MRTDILDETRLDSEGLTRLVAELQKSKEDLEARRFVEQSLARFASVMRWRPDDTLQAWVERLLEELAITVNASQACLFISQKDAEGGAYLRRIGAFALGDFTENETVPFGEGVVGQVAKSGRGLYFTSEARLHARTYSALTVLNPQALLVQPLSYNEGVEGVLEVSALREFSPEELDFLRAVGESVAANLMSVRAQEEMKGLFQEAQRKTEQLQAQEEEMRQNVEELQATQEEMRRQQGEVAQREARLNALINTPADGIIVVDTQYQIVLANRAFIEMYPDRPMEVNKTRIQQVFAPEEWSLYAPFFERAFTGQAGTDTFVLKGGASCLEIDYNPIKGFDGEVSGVAVFSRDVTERENRENELRRSQTLLADFLNSTQNLFFGVDSRLTLTVANEAVGKLFGIRITPGETRFQELFPEAEEQTRYIPFIRQALEGFETTIEARFKNDYFERYFEVTFNPILNENETVSAVAVFAADVSEKITQRKALEDEREKLYTFLNSINDPIWALDAEETIILANNKLHENYENVGLKITEGQTKFRELLSAEQYAAYNSVLSRALTGETVREDIHFHNEHFDLFYEITVSPIKHADDKPEAVVVVARDVTGQRITERQVREQAEWLDGIINSTQDYIAAFNLKGEILAFNQPFHTLIGELTGGMVPHIGQSFEDVLARTTNPALIVTFSRKKAAVLKGERVVSEIEARVPNERLIYLETTYSPILAHDGSVIAITLFARDITERKASEIERQKNRDLLQLSQRLAQIGSLVIELKSGKITWSDETYTIFGRPKDTELTLDTFEEMIFPEDLAAYKEKTALALESGARELRAEYRIRRGDNGAVVYIFNVANIVRDDHGAPIRIEGMVRDLSESKQRQIENRHGKEEIARLNDFLTAVFDALPAALYIKDAAELKFVGWNKTAELYFHLSKEAVMGKTDLDFFPKEEAETFRAQDRRVLDEGGIHYLPEDKITTTDGSVLYLRSFKRPLYDRDGKAQYLLGISMDITAEKESLVKHHPAIPIVEGGLYEEEEAVRPPTISVPFGIRDMTPVLRVLPDVAFVADDTLRVVHVSEALDSKLKHIQTQDGTNETLVYAFMPEDKRAYYENVYELVSLGETIREQEGLLERVFTPIFDESKRFLGVVVTEHFEVEKAETENYAGSPLLVEVPEGSPTELQTRVQELISQNAELQQSFAELFSLHNELEASTGEEIKRLKEQIDNEKRVMLRTIEHFKQIESQYKQQIVDKDFELDTLRKELRKLS